jgi:hypothetical protein
MSGQQVIFIKEGFHEEKLVLYRALTGIGSLCFPGLLRKRSGKD